MKRIFSILFNTLAVITLLVSVSVPHHHHGETVCITANHCEHGCGDEAHDDEKYSSHHHDDRETSDANCVAKASYVVSDQSELINKIRPYDQYIHDIHFIPVFLGLVTLYNTTGAKFICLTKYRYRKKIFFRELDSVNLINGLRAPPYSIA
ncbi:MAG: hypothetical protein LBQ01_03820 [Prevotellaceae bacterium]|jgi:hypothetical protein|nr:hypothetical protein [Prevotellaceae bacterium]